MAIVRPFLIFYELNEHIQSSYEALAHILVGGLFAAYFTNRRVFNQPGGNAYAIYEDFGYMLWVAVARVWLKLFARLRTYSMVRTLIGER